MGGLRLPYRRRVTGGQGAGARLSAIANFKRQADISPIMFEAGTDPWRTCVLTLWVSLIKIPLIPALHNRIARCGERASV